MHLKEVANQIAAFSLVDDIMIKINHKSNTKSYIQIHFVLYIHFILFIACRSLLWVMLSKASALVKEKKALENPTRSKGFGIIAKSLISGVR